MIAVEHTRRSRPAGLLYVLEFPALVAARSTIVELTLTSLYSVIATLIAVNPHRQQREG